MNSASIASSTWGSVTGDSATLASRSYEDRRNPPAAADGGHDCVGQVRAGVVDVVADTLASGQLDVNCKLHCGCQQGVA